MPDRNRLEGRVALITGGGRGIGRAIALAYAAEGCRLALTARTASELEETAKLVAGRFGSDAITVVADVSAREDVEQAVAQTLGHYGAIDVLVNNAGNIGPVGRLWDNDPEDWARTIVVHLMGVFYGCHAVLPSMLERGRGRIVNMSGVGGPNTSAYDAAKTAIVNLTENLALELSGTRITVNAISPARSIPGCGGNAGPVVGHRRYRHLRAGRTGYLGSGGLHRAGGGAGGLLGQRRLRSPVGTPDPGLCRPVRRVPWKS